MRKNSSQKGLAVPPIDTVSGFSSNPDGGMVIDQGKYFLHNDLEQLPLYEQAAQTLKFHPAKMVEGLNSEHQMSFRADSVQQPPLPSRNGMISNRPPNSERHMMHGSQSQGSFMPIYVQEAEAQSSV